LLTLTRVTTQKATICSFESHRPQSLIWNSELYPKKPTPFI
jgi:hypothetical protein